MRGTGMMFSAGMVMLIFAIYIGSTQVTSSSYPLFMKSVKYAFMIFASLCFAGIFASLARGRRNKFLLVH